MRLYGKKAIKYSKMKTNLMTGNHGVSGFLKVLFLTFAFLVLLHPLASVFAQIPSGFNYQAVARDGATGNPITTAVDVRFTIQSDTLGGTVFWVEEHYGVDPDDNGVFSVVIGKGTRISGLSAFRDIDWTVWPKFIMTHINYGGWKLIGSSRLWAVPYAMVADSLGGPLKTLLVKGTATSLEEPLFEVKNYSGQTVFAVYNEGVRIYVDDGDLKGKKGGFAVGSFVGEKGESDPFFVVKPDSVRVYIDRPGKASKGGFAVGGYTAAKDDGQQYLFISSDSIRAYIDTTSVAKGAKGGFAVGGFSSAKGKLPEFLNIDPDNETVINPSENRILYYPVKNSFLVGRVLVEDSDSVGTNSVATGYESKAIGNWSQALGYKSVARGDYSTAIGKNATAWKRNSFALGDSSQANFEGAYAMGYKALASGLGSLAFGYAFKDEFDYEWVTTATGASSIAIGIGSRALADGAVAVGAANEATGLYSLALGLNSVASNESAVAIGYQDTASGYSSYASGVWTKALGDFSYAVGYNSVAVGMGASAMAGDGLALGDISVVMGSETEAGATGAIAMGYRSHSDGQFAFAGGLESRIDSLCDYSLAYGFQTRSKNACTVSFGNNTEASGYGATAIGYSTEAIGNCSFAIGNETRAVSHNSAALGQFNIGYGDSYIEIGNGADDLSRNNVLTLRGTGYLGLGLSDPAYRLQLPNDNSDSGRGMAFEWITYSDARVKTDLVDLPYGLDLIRKLKPVSYNHHSSSFSEGALELGSSVRSIGLLAQDLYQIMPEAVIRPADESTQLWGIDYNKLVPVLINAIKEQQQQIEELKAIVGKLTAGREE
jgi:hypothetical protein